MRTTLDNIHFVAEQFRPRGRVIDIRVFGNGNINDTFLVTLEENADTLRREHFILQRINTLVFHHPELVMRNMRISTEHIHRRLDLKAPGNGRRWEVPSVLLTQDNKDHWIDSEGSFWRAISFIEGSQTFETIRDIAHAAEVGYALGFFHSLLSNLPPERLADTLPGFHVTPGYLQHYDEVLSKHGGSRSTDANYCFKFVEDRTGLTRILEDARAQGRLFFRPIHGDPKVNNILMDIATGQAISIVDLDTVKPGLVHYDIGDCLRSGCNPSGEETEKWEDVHFEPDL
jgi:hypothetical protein